MMQLTRASRLAFAMSAVLGTLACGSEEEAALDVAHPDAEAQALSCDDSIVVENELFIRDLAIVEDPVRTRWSGNGSNGAADGAWHFGKLMAAMAGQQDASEFVRSWLAHWSTDQTVNGFTAAARPRIGELLLDAWPKDHRGKLDLSKAPLRLLAIVNRMDLRKLAEHNAGEGRFVFGVLDSQGFPQPFTVILEYKLIAHNSNDAKRWLRDWHALGRLPLGSEQYKVALQRITDAFAGRGVAVGHQNGSAISQVRTNEIALAGPWELREFHLGSDMKLHEETVALTPDRSFENTDDLARFINRNEADIIAERHDLPLQQDGRALRANSITNNIDVWTAPGVNNNEARHKLSLNTCNGCHGAETNTGFLHVNNRMADQQAFLSPFMTGVDVNDPVSGQTRHFDELGRRRDDLRSLLCAVREGPWTIGPKPSRVH
jgi:hypothetical protein